MDYFNNVQSPPASPLPGQKGKKKKKPKLDSSLGSMQKVADGWVEIDPMRNYELDEPVVEPDNKYAQPTRIRADLIYRVTQFGYTQDKIMESLINNEANHEAATYYLLEKNYDII